MAEAESEEGLRPVPFSSLQTSLITVSGEGVQSPGMGQDGCPQKTWTNHLTSGLERGQRITLGGSLIFPRGELGSRGQGLCPGLEEQKQQESALNQAR